MRSAEELLNKRVVFENAPETPRNLAILAVIDEALQVRGGIDAEITEAAEAVIPGDVLSVAPYDAWVWADGLSQHLDPDADAPKAELQIEPTGEEQAKK